MVPLTVYGRVKSRRKIDSILKHLEIAQNHINDLWDMGYGDREIFAESLGASAMVLNELRKLLLRLREEI